MILVDTNVIVALADERDRLHADAARHLATLSGPFAVTSVVLSETCFLIPECHLRQRVRFLIDRLPLKVLELDVGSWPALFDWLFDYAEHEPDLCDGQLTILAHQLRAGIWTYDAQFRDLWRAPDGSSLRVLPDTPRRSRRRRRKRAR